MSQIAPAGGWILQVLGPRVGYPNWRSYAIRDAVTNVHIATVGNVDLYYEGEQQAAQAALIARAPDLLRERDELREALRALLDWGRTYTSPTDPNSPHVLLIAAHDALAKVTP